jgi:hypothetical protein
MTPPSDATRRGLLGSLLGAALVAALPLLAAERKFPDVVDVKVRARTADTFDFDVTVSSPYDSAQRHADGFRVVTADGKLLGERKLWHDHCGEQPFTRDLYGVLVPPGVRVVRVQARDQCHGYGGMQLEVSLPGR